MASKKSALPQTPRHFESSEDSFDIGSRHARLLDIATYASCSAGVKAEYYRLRIGSSKAAFAGDGRGEQRTHLPFLCSAH